MLANPSPDADHHPMSHGEAPIGVTPRRARGYLELATGFAVLDLTAMAVSPLQGKQLDGQMLLLAGALLAACWLVDSVNVPAGLDRAGRFLSLSGVNALLFPAAILLPPSLFVAVAVGTELPALGRHGWHTPVVNGCIRSMQVCAAAITFFAICDSFDPSEGPIELGATTIAALVGAGVAMLVVESLAVGRLLRLEEDLLPEDLPLLEPRDLLRNSPDVAIGALACILLGTAPFGVVLLVPLFLLQRTALRAHAARLGNHRDAKTGLLTYEVFLDLAHREVARARRTQQPLSLLMLDVDGLKWVNTRHGHLAGDRLIAEMGLLLQRNCREEDLVARFGGDEFYALLPGADLAGAICAAERIRQRAERTTVLGIDPPLTLGISVGATEVVGDDDLSAALARADRGLRLAKQAGRNRVEVVEPVRR